MRKISMMLLAFVGMLGMVSCTNTESASKEDFTTYVEPRIGTAHCRYFHMAPGALPFGMARKLRRTGTAPTLTGIVWTKALSLGALSSPARSTTVCASVPYTCAMTTGSM